MGGHNCIAWREIAIAGRGIAATWALCLLSGQAIAAAPSKSLQPGDHLTILGDSITEQRLFSVYVEDYLLMCQPVSGVVVSTFGWGGETAPGLAARMADDVLCFHPTAAIVVLGMNDGAYGPPLPEKTICYYKGLRSIVAQLRRSRVGLVLLASPGCVDADFYRPSPLMAPAYNQTLADLRNVARLVAAETACLFANVHDPMLAVMRLGKAKYGPGYHLAGADGLHPDCNGHLVMAYAMLKSLGFTGHIGTIRVNWSQQTAAASEGHRVLSCRGGAVELESTRYPFCFFGAPGHPSATRSVVEFLPFNEELNRLTLVVTGLEGQRVLVRWGSVGKEFSGDKLAKGINLAAEFLENPFCEPFRRVEEHVRRKQNVECSLAKWLSREVDRHRVRYPDDHAGIERLAATAREMAHRLQDETAAAVRGVRHTLVIKPQEDAARK